MQVIPRSEIQEDIYRDILDKETHHNHEIIVEHKLQDGEPIFRWKPNPVVSRHLQHIHLSELLGLLRAMGFGKNSEVYRKLYRDMGYSLFGYWEIFYWEVNNEEAAQYTPQPLEP